MLDKQYTNSDSVMSSYFSEISRIPLLTKEEEIKLAVKAKNGNKAAKDKLVTSNLKFVIKLAKQYQNLGLDIEDLISEGNLGLIEAVDHFNPEKGFRFLPYAVWWIRRSILKAIEEKGRPIRLPANKIQEMREIESVRSEFTKQMTTEEEIEKIASTIGMSKEHVREIMIISNEFVSFDAPISSKTSTQDDSVRTVGDAIIDERQISLEEQAIQENLKRDVHKTLETLPKREAEILRYRFGFNNKEKLSLQSVGKLMNITKERVRQIEKSAFMRMRQYKQRVRLEGYIA
ncbi:MAG: sigma-70 family RNA polymerase sigma factor [Treponema sp.]|jgi:RNA polymerase primary sigma factor|nr:sigma-70 family RNA polymerase sigma factor [Treponema sp.]